jgi:DNA-binding GntR family transcriptional regulator
MEFILESGLRARDMLVHNRSDWPDSVPVHHAILTAVEARDSVGAEQAVLELLDQSVMDAGQVRQGQPGPSQGEPGRGDEAAE